jgi:hypothetical protein
MNFEVGQVIEEYGYKFEVQMWPIEKILKTITQSADFPEFDGTPSMWAYLIASKCGDAYTPVLAQKILDEGFTDPICIYRGHLGGLAIGNGHHRLVCAIILGIDEVPVLFTETDESYPDASDGPNIFQYDEEVSDWLYSQYTKTYKKLFKQESKAEEEEWTC